jgi:hypothetical protein
MVINRSIHCSPTRNSVSHNQADFCASRCSTDVNTNSFRAILLAWPLGVNERDEPYSVRLTSQSRHISGHRSHVGIITAHNEVLVWQVGGQLKPIATSALKEQLPGCAVRTLGVVFDPEDEQRHFVVHVASTEIPDTNGAYMTILAVQVSAISNNLSQYLYQCRPISIRASRWCLLVDSVG